MKDLEYVDNSIFKDYIPPVSYELDNIIEDIYNTIIGPFKLKTSIRGVDTYDPNWYSFPNWYSSEWVKLEKYLKGDKNIDKRNEIIAEFLSDVQWFWDKHRRDYDNAHIPNIGYHIVGADREFGDKSLPNTTGLKQCEGHSYIIDKFDDFIFNNQKE